MSESQGTLPEARAKPRRRTPRAPAKGVKPPEEFFSELIQALLADGGVPGAFSNSSIEMLANPANAVKWYASYVLLCENYQDAVSGKIQVQLRQFPECIREKVADLLGSD